MGIIEAQAILSQAFQVNFWSIVPFEQNQKSFYYTESLVLACEWFPGHRTLNGVVFEVESKDRL